jgi:hypothetical protein
LEERKKMKAKESIVALTEFAHKASTSSGMPSALSLRPIYFVELLFHCYTSDRLPAKTLT